MATGRVLIVDDDRDFADGLCDLLESRGYRIDVAYTAEEARRRLADFDAQVALVDIRLGGQSGVDLVGELKRIRPNALCVMVTAHADLENTIKSLQEGVFDFLRKPFEPAALFISLDRCAERIRLEREKAEAVEDLLELSRIGRLVNPPEEVPLGELVNEALQLVRGQIEQRSVQVELSPNLPVAFGDRTRLLEVLQNLIDNAVKYMGDEPHPRIEIGDRRDGDETICYVRDNGIGIEPRYHEKVFGLFDQLDQKVEGSGIGLALVKRIVEVHGGRIWVESPGLGHGSTFCFTIAARNESTEPRGSEPCITGRR